MLLEFYHPGGVKHANQVQNSKPPPLTSSDELEKEKVQENFVESTRKVDVQVKGLGLVVSTGAWYKRGPKQDKSILTEVDAFFPSGQVSVIMGPSGVSPFLNVFRSPII